LKGSLGSSKDRSKPNLAQETKVEEACLRTAVTIVNIMGYSCVLRCRQLASFLLDLIFFSR